MSIGFWQIAIVVILVVLLFGRGKISSLMGDVAKGIKSFKKGMSTDVNEDSDQKNISDLMNMETISLYEVDNQDWKNHLLDLLKDFYKETKSKRAEFIIENYDSEIKKFAHVVPDEVIDKLEFPVTKKSKIA